VAPPTPGVTVVVAAHDAGATVGDAVRSALRQPPVVQCVVVDDASRDATALVAGACASEDPRVEVLRRARRGGPSIARDDGLVAARAPLVCFLDADDVLLDGGLEALAEALAAEPDAVAALGRFVAVDDAGAGAEAGAWASEQLRPVVRRHGRLVDSTDGLSAEALVTRLVSPPPGAWLVDAASTRAVGGFDPRVPRSEDVELLVRLATAGRVVVVERDVLAYRRHDAQRSASGARRRWGRSIALWYALRAAPGAAATWRLSRGMVAYHVELFAARRRADGWRVRAMALRNLGAAAALSMAGAVAAPLPRRLPPPLRRTADAVD
jgi:succinoglycan biosynthesis protein ExoU